jgi:PhnB protein
MSGQTPAPGPVETHLAPWLAVRNATEALDYYRQAFGAEELYRLEGDPGQPVVAHLSIRGADFWLQDDPASSPTTPDGGPVRMILTVDDPDAVFARALAAGATAVAPVADGHGWRIGRVVDPFGHHWEIGRPLT